MTSALRLPAWTPPAPVDLPDLRTRLLDHSDSKTNLYSLSQAVNAGRASVLPVMAHSASIGALAAPLLARLEGRRLREANLYLGG